ncbi:MAG TPA: YetF domain-containing protein [Flavobacterium sp.]|nr:YetF domain-containing protein [Flavobacterium sp.]
MDTKSFFLGNEDSLFLIEIMIRTAIMFIIILLFLRLLGKRGIKQLSVFELVVIIGLGSAAGDPMIYKEIGILNAFITFGIVVLCYKLLTFLVFRYKIIENIVEGKPVCIIKKGLFAIENFKKESLSEDEFFMELRVQGVYHLGQIEIAILEISGEISIYFYPEDKVRYGLPIVPPVLKKIVKAPKSRLYYSCLFCGNTLLFQKNSPVSCCRCNKRDWVLSSNRKREK